MKRFTLLLIAGLVCFISISSAQFDYSYQGRSRVGYQPVSIYNINVGPGGMSAVVYCAGKDVNYNGQLDAGDEAPSLWLLPIPILTRFGSNDVPLGLLDAEKLLDLEFKMPILPVRNYWDDNENKLYILNENSISAVTFTYNGGRDSAHESKVVDVKASAVSSRNNYLYFSIRPNYTDPGFVAVYDKIQKKFTDTIPAGVSVQQTIPTNDGKLLIISEGTFGKGGGKFQIADISGAKHLLLKEITIDGTPTHIDFSQNEKSVYITCNTSNKVMKLNLTDYTLDSLVLNLGTYQGPRESTYETTGTMSGYLLTSAYDGYVYIHKDKKLYGKFDAKTVPEGFKAIFGLFFIATPYINEKYDLDSNVTIYAEPFDDVAENASAEGYYVYPNPVIDIFDIATPEGSAVNSISVYDMMGQKIAQIQATDQKEYFSAKSLGLTSGSYFIRVENQLKSYLLPMIIK